MLLQRPRRERKLSYHSHSRNDDRRPCQRSTENESETPDRGVNCRTRFFMSDVGMATLNRWGRIGGVAACFVVAGIAGITYAIAVFPALRLLPGGPAARARRVRVVIGRSFAALIAVLQRGGVMRLEKHNIERLRGAGAVLVLANHPCYLDIVVLLAHIPHG